MEANLLWAETIRTTSFPGTGLGCKGWGWGWESPSSGRSPCEGRLARNEWRVKWAVGGNRSGWVGLMGVGPDGGPGLK